MKILVSCLLLFLIVKYGYGQLRVAASPSIIGSVYRNVTELKEFKGYKKVEGSVLELARDHYSIATIVKGNYNILLFEKILQIGDGSTVKYKLLDTLNIGLLKKPYTIAYSACRISRKNDSEIVALVKGEYKEYFTKILKAWRANKKTKRFEKTSIKGVDCFDNGYSNVD
ncbi:MAG: hypothetical protein EOP45_15415 [Sphingobacteriaceae bacterium]|nr:MAG: hypothetical protein EOP45_15415 [Sphingobacteriaceae bacterium]